MIDKYLESLTNDRDTLADNLTAKGISGITGDETFTELVPEILNIETEPNLQDKSITIAQNGTTIISCDGSYDGLNSVQIVTDVSGGGGVAPEIQGDTIIFSTGASVNNNTLVVGE